MKRDDLLW